MQFRRKFFLITMLLLCFITTLPATAQSTPLTPPALSPMQNAAGFPNGMISPTDGNVALAGLRSPRSSWHTINTRLRIAWGGGTAVRWTGTIEVSEGHFQLLTNYGLELRPSSTITRTQNQGEISTLQNRIDVNQSTPQSYDALDVTLTTSRNARLKVNLVSADNPDLTFEVDRPIEQFLNRSLDMDLDQQGNRGQIRRTPGDILRIQHQRRTLVFQPNEVFDLTLIPHLLGRERFGSFLYTANVLTSDNQQIIHQQQHAVEIEQTGEFPLWKNLKIPVPSRPGVYSIVFRVESKKFTDTLVRAAPLATRRVQFVVVGGVNRPPSDQARWKEIVSFNPADPAWWKRLLSINPTDQIKYLTGSSPSDLGFQPFGNGKVQEFKHLEKPYSKLTEGGWQAYPLTVEHVNRPHLLEIDYPADIQQTLGISILEPNALGKIIPLGIDSGFYHHQPEWSSDQSPLKHKLLFWPKTNHPMLVLRNQFGTRDAIYGQIKVSELQGNLRELYQDRFPTDPNEPRELADTRKVLTYYNKPLFAENFGAQEARTTDNATTLDDWQTFYQGGMRLADYLQFSGNAGTMLNVLSEGSSLFPSNHFESLPKYDSGAFFSNGQDPLKKDVLEMLLRIFNERQLKLVPTLQLSMCLRELEAIGEQDKSIYLQIAPTGMENNELYPRYNPLDPRVQRAIRNFVLSIVSRYKHHSSFAGICLELSPNTYTHLPGTAWTPDTITLSRFFETQQLSPSDSHEENLQAIRQRYRKQWQLWVQAELMQLYVQLADDLKQQSDSSTKLYLATGALYDTPQARQLARPIIPPQNRLTSFLTSLGLDPTATKSLEQVVWLHPQRSNPILDPVRQHVELEVNRSNELIKLHSQGRSTGVLFEHTPHVAKLTDLEAQSPWGQENTNTWFANTLTPSSQFNRQRFISALAKSDHRVLVDGGWMLTMGQEDTTRAIFHCYQSLPDVPFETVKVVNGATVTQPLVIRRHISTAGNQPTTYLYVLNNAPWATTAQVELLLPPNGHPVALGQKAKSSFRWHPKGATWQLVMEPFDFIAVRIDHAEADVIGANVQFNQEVITRLHNSILKVNQRLGPLQQPSSRTPLKNADFEAPAVNQVTPGWLYNSQAGNRIEVVRESAQNGNQHLSIHRPDSSRQVLWVRSEPFNVPPTGRVAFTVWMRTSTPNRQPSIRLSIEGRLQGKVYYRPRTIGRPESGITTTSHVNPLSANWNRYVLIVDDLPTQGLTDLRVGFDLMTPGHVEIDNLQVYDLWFQQREYRELMKDISVAYSHPGQGRVSDCFEYLNSYWPQYLAKYATPNRDQIARQARLPESEKEDSPASVWPKLPNVIEQFKELPTKLFPFQGNE